MASSPRTIDSAGIARTAAYLWAERARVLNAMTLNTPHLVRAIGIFERVLTQRLIDAMTEQSDQTIILATEVATGRAPSGSNLDHAWIAARVSVSQQMQLMDPGAWLMIDSRGTVRHSIGNS